MGNSGERNIRKGWKRVGLGYTNDVKFKNEKKKREGTKKEKSKKVKDYRKGWEKVTGPSAI